MDVVTWHEVEFGSIDNDLPVWEGILAEVEGPILEVGAGIGRLTRHLSALGHRMVALDYEPALLEELRARDPRVLCVEADARRLLPAVPHYFFNAIIVPMLTYHMLGPLEDRQAFLAGAMMALAPEGILAIDLALEGDEEWSDEADWPEADTLERSGVSYVSQPVAVTRVEPDVVELTRLRITDDGPPEVDRVREWDASLSELLEAVEPVLGLEGVHPVPATAAWAGTEIVVLR